MPTQDNHKDNNNSSMPKQDNHNDNNNSSMPKQDKNSNHNNNNSSVHRGRITSARRCTISRMQRNTPKNQCNELILCIDNDTYGKIQTFSNNKNSDPVINLRSGSDGSPYSCDQNGSGERSLAQRANNINN